MLGISGDFKFRDLAGKFLPDGGANINRLANDFKIGEKFGVNVGGSFKIGF